MRKRFLQIIAAVLFLGFLSACDSAEERAEQHFQKGLELHEAGDTPRAIVELRNVFQLNGSHLEGRLLMARIEEERGNLVAAYGQYLAVTESQPAHFPARYAAARLASNLGDWEAAERHVKAALDLPEGANPDPVLAAVDIGVAYRQAHQTQDFVTASQLADQASELLSVKPDLIFLRRMLIEHWLIRQDWEVALRELDTALEFEPEARLLYALRLSVLRELGQPKMIEAQLRDMIDLFPEDETLPRTLVQWYVHEERIDDAERYLRDRISAAEDKSSARLMLIDFLIQLRGPEQTLVEIEEILAKITTEDPDRALYRAARASLVFDMGDPETAIAAMQTILEGTDPSDQTRGIKLALARMLEQTDNPVGARALVEEVLQEDTTNVEALKMRAARLIAADRPDEALVDLRRALDQEPRQASIFTLMAQAQGRAGSRDLMGEMLSMAVETSVSSPAESQRYAEYLLRENRPLVAESVLIDALRLRPDNVQILNLLGDIYLRLEDWPRMQGIIDTLARIEDDQAAALADTLTVRLLSAQDRQSELRALFEQLAAVPGSNNEAVLAVVRLRLAEGDFEGARAFLDKSLGAAPDNPDLRLISAGLMALDGEREAASEILQSLLEQFPQNERIWMSLYDLHRRSGDQDTADAVLTDALRALPESGVLNWILASNLEQDGDIAGAIDVYERLYALDTNSPVIANNLASLLSSFRGHEADTLERAYAIARRLRGSEVPQFQDTYGWIAARLGNFEEALEHLEPAAAALPQDPNVRYHLARTYAMAERDTDALEAFRVALELIDAVAGAESRPMPPRDDITGEIKRLEAEAATVTD